MANEKNKEKFRFTDYDPVEDPEDIIKKDTDENRKKAFRESIERIKVLGIQLFGNGKKKRKNSSDSSSGGGNSFMQNIVVTKDMAKIENNVNVQDKGKEEKREDREIGD